MTLEEMAEFLKERIDYCGRCDFFTPKCYLNSCPNDPVINWLKSEAISTKEVVEDEIPF